MAVPYDQMPQPMEMPDDMADEYPMEEVEEVKHPLLEYLDKGNLVGELETEKRTNAEITSKILTLYEDAKASMESWHKKYKRAMALAKLQPMSGDHEIDSKDFPFEGASLVMLPYVMEAMLDFQARAAAELVWSGNIVKAQVYGKNSTDKEERAKRVSDYSNYQLSELIPNWREDQDKGLLILPGMGTLYKRTYFDYDTQETCSELCLADEIIFNHSYKSFDKAPDKFRPCKYTRNELIGFIRGDQGWDIDEDDLEDDKDDFEFIEAYTWIDLDDDGLKEPYIATIWEDKSKIVCLYPYFDDDTLTLTEDEELIKIDPLDSFTQYRFLPDPEGGPMGMGWGILLGPMFDAINTNVRQLIDSGTLHNTASNSGLISQSMASGRGNAVQSGPIEVIQGQLTPIQNHGVGSLKDNIVQLPFAGPSAVLFQLMEYLVNSARAMANASVNVEAQAGEAASLYLARLQQGLKVPNSIVMRVYECAKKEFQKIANLNYKHFDDEKYNRVLDSETQHSMEKDFDPEDCDIRMVADPSKGSDIERIQRAQTIYEMAKDPQQPGQVLDYRKTVIDVLNAMNATDVEELAPEPDPNARDPMAEMQQAMIAQQMAQMELDKRSQDLREAELTLKTQKQAMDAAKEMARLGLDKDMNEAKITQMYADSLKKLVEAGIASGQQAIDAAKQIEQQFIGDTGGRTPGQIPPNNQQPVGNMAQQPGNPNIPPMPEMVGGANQGGNG